MISTEPISINALSAQMTTPWRPIDLVKVNSSIVRLVRLDGRFNWHTHNEDELFIAREGHFSIEVEGEIQVPLGPGDCYLIPAGVRHRPVASHPAYALLVVEPQTEHDFGVVGPA